jgi:hypothetical protein
LSLDPGTDLVGFLSELATQGFVILLLSQLSLQGGISLGDQLSNVSPFLG